MTHAGFVRSGFSISWCSVRTRNYQFSEGIKDDVRGSTVYGVNEEQLGKIDDLIFDEKSGSIKYAIIDSGGWLQNRRFLLPPEQLRQSHQREGDFEASSSAKLGRPCVLTWERTASRRRPAF